jgi:hypothetical protein
VLSFRYTEKNCNFAQWGSYCETYEIKNGERNGGREEERK